MGLLASVCIAYLQHKQDITIKIIEQYFAAREQLCDQLSALANLQVTSSCKLDTATLAEYQENISKLFYKYYDFLPPEVLKEMLCLHACLSDKENRLYKHENNCLILIEDKDIEGFIGQISLIDNFKYYAPIPLESKDPNIRRAASVNYQARSVLVSMNYHFTIQHLRSWNRYLQKSKETKSKLRNTPLNGRSLLQTNLPSKGIITCNQDNVADRLAVIMASILGLSKVEPNDNFFELGGDSLLTMQLASHVNREFNIQIPLRAIFEAPTPQDLSMKIVQLTLHSE